MNLFDAAILGIIEGVTEFLPISSTAHLVLGAKLLRLQQTDFVKSFEIIIQLGAILAVVTLYFKSLCNIDVLKKVFVGFLPTAIVGLLAYKKVKQYLGDESIVLWSLFVGGVLLIVFEYYYKRRESDVTNTITYRQSVIIGLCQCIAFIPGVSRSAATIIGGMMQGISRTAIAEFSFLLAVPTMCAASGLDILKNKEALIHIDNLSALLLGFVVSYVVAIFAIKSFLSFVKRHDFTVFGVYRILIVVLFWIFIY